MQGWIPPFFQIVTFCVSWNFCINFDFILKYFSWLLSFFDISRLVPHELHSSPGPGVDVGGEGVSMRE